MEKLKISHISMGFLFFSEFNELEYIQINKNITGKLSKHNLKPFNQSLSYLLKTAFLLKSYNLVQQ